MKESNINVSHSDEMTELVKKLNCNSMKKDLCLVRFFDGSIGNCQMICIDYWLTGDCLNTLLCLISTFSILSLENFCRMVTFFSYLMDFALVAEYDMISIIQILYSLFCISCSTGFKIELNYTFLLGV